MKSSNSRPFLILTAIAALLLPAAPAMAAGWIIGSGGASLGAGSMDLGCGDLEVNGTLNLDSGSLTGVGSVIIGPNGVINGGSGSIDLSGDWTNNHNPGSAGFVAGTSQVTWNRNCSTATINVSGDTTFYNFTLNDGLGREIDFAAGSHTTIAAGGNMIMTGGASLLKIRSSTSGTQAYLKVLGSYTINHVDVADNNAELPGAWIDPGFPAAHFDSVDSGNNFRWFGTAKFDVYKTWNESNVPADTPVQVHIVCTSGVDLNQTTTIYQAQHGTFTVNGFSDPTDCTITETVPPGYTASYSISECNAGNCSETNSTSCSFETVYSVSHRCDITNTPDPATITITKSWIVEGGDQGYDPNYQIKLRCDDNETIWYNGSSYNGKVVVWGKASSTPKDFEFTIPEPGYPASNCTIIEVNNDNVVKSDMSDCVPKDGYQYNSEGHYDRTKNLVDIEVSAGDEIACEIVNTVFFEGIPTLNRYGLAMLALLMLGVGLIGFRRLV